MAVLAGFPDNRLLVRQAELATLRAKLADAAAGLPRFVLIEGELGMGKTTLLDQFVAVETDAGVIRASGEEFETQLRYGVVEQLCRSIDAPLPRALAALSEGPMSPAEPFAVGAALLDLMGRLETRAPLVVVIDDAHLADTPSQLALLFALRGCNRSASWLSSRPQPTALRWS